MKSRLSYFLRPRVAFCATIFGAPFLLQNCVSSFLSGKENAKVQKVTNQTSQTDIKIPNNKGLLWFPFAWQVKLDPSSAAKIGSLQMRNVNLVLFHLQKKQNVMFKLSRAATGTKLETAAQAPFVGVSNGVLDPRDDELLFVNQQNLELDEGDYNIHAVRVGFVDPNSSKTLFNDFPIPNPFRADQETSSNAKSVPASVQIKSQKVSAAFRVMMTTQLKKTEGSAPALSGSSFVESIDRDVIPLSLVSKQMGAKLTQEFFAASADIPRARVPLVNEEFQPIFGGKESASAGMMLEYPCGTKNWLKLVWKKSGEDKEYEFPVELGAQEESQAQKQKRESGEACMQTKFISMPLTAHDWQLKSSHIVDTGALPTFRTGSLKEVVQGGSLSQSKTPISQFLKTYYGLDMSPLLVPNSGNERDLSKPFLVKIAKKSKLSVTQSQGILFLGKFRLVSNKDAAREQQQTWDLLFDRTYNLKDLRAGFKNETIQNAYTLDEMRKDKLLGQVNAVLRASFAGVDKRSLEPVQDELRAGIAGEFKTCLLDREVSDPLVNTTANLEFSLLKGTQNLSLKKSEIDGDLESGPWMKDCLEKKVLQLRLKKKIPANLQGEINVKTD